MSKIFVVIAVIAIALLTFAAPAQGQIAGGNGGLVNVPGGGGFAIVTVHNADDIAVLVDLEGNVTVTGSPYRAVAPLFGVSFVTLSSSGDDGDEVTTEAIGGGGPSVTIEAEWLGTDGKIHRVKTTIPPGAVPEQYIERHDRVVRAMEQYYPRAPNP